MQACWRNINVQVSRCDSQLYLQPIENLLQSIREFKSYGVQVSFLNNGEVMESGSEFILTILDVMHNKKVAIYFKKLNIEVRLKYLKNKRKLT